jgi:hypothetical protein
MRLQLRQALAAAVLASLWGVTPILSRAQSPDTGPAPDVNPAQSSTGYANTQAVPAQAFPANNGALSTAQPATPPAMPATNVIPYNPPAIGYGNVPPPTAVAPQPSSPNLRPPVNTMRANYVGQPSWMSVVPRGNVGQPSYVTAKPLSAISPAGRYVGQPSWVTAQPHGNVAHPSYATAKPLSAISPAGQFPGRPTWAVGQPTYNVGTPSYMSIQMRGNLGQLATPIQNGRVFMLPGSYPPGSLNQYAPGMLQQR